MPNKQTHKPSLGERIHERDVKAAHNLADKNVFERLWARSHLSVANTTDATYTAAGSRPVKIAWGIVKGLAAGVGLGIIAGSLFAYTPLIGLAAAVTGNTVGTIAAGTVFNAVAGISVLGMGLKGAVDGHDDALQHDSSKVGAKVAEKIARRGHALSNDTSPAVAKAVAEASERLNTRPDSTAAVTPGVEPKNKFQTMVNNSRAPSEHVR